MLVWLSKVAMYKLDSSNELLTAQPLVREGVK